MCPELINEDAQDFQKNSEAIGNLLSKSETGKRAEEYTNELFFIIDQSQITERDQKKAELFKGGYKEIRKTHRPDLERPDLD